MKNSYAPLTGIFLAIFTFTSSCTVQRPLYTKGLHVEWHAFNSKSSWNSQADRENQKNTASALSNDEESEPLNGISESAIINNPWEPTLIASATSCPVTVTQGSESAPYIKAHNQNPGQRAIHNARGTKAETKPSLNYIPVKKTYSPANNGKKLEILSLLSMIFSIVGLFAPYAGLAFIVAGLVLGILGLLKFKKNPDMYWGRGFAIAGISIAGFALFLLILLLALVGTLFLFAL